MSTIVISPASSGAAQFTIASPATATNRTITLPDATDTLVGAAATQTLTNKIIQGGTINEGTALSGSGTALSFTAIPSWAARIIVTVTGLTSASAFRPVIRVGSASFASSGYTSSAAAIASGSGTSTDTTGLMQNYVATTSHSFSAMLINQTGNVWVSTGTGIYPGGATYAFGYVSLSGVLDRIQVTSIEGVTLTGGTVNITWEG